MKSKIVYLDKNLHAKLAKLKKQEQIPTISGFVERAINKELKNVEPIQRYDNGDLSAEWCEWADHQHYRAIKNWYWGCFRRNVKPIIVDDEYLGVEILPRGEVWHGDF